MEHLPYILPKSPDPYIERGLQGQNALARLAHLNPLIDRINLLQDLIDSSETGITAHAGGGQTLATQLTATYNEVTTVASAGDSVKLAAAVEGIKQIVKNDGANNLAVFPATGDSIDDGTVNASITIAPGGTITFTAISDSNWETSNKSVSVGKTLFVDITYGNDTTAKPYDPAYAYATIAAAVTAAISGDLIWVRPGTYPVSTNILKEGVSFYCDKGVKITSTSLLFNADTTTGGTTLTLPYFFLGHAFINDTDLGGEGFLVTRTNPNANITIETDAVTTANTSNGMILRDGYVNFLVRGNYSNGGRCFRLQDTSNLDAEIWGTCTTTVASNFNAIVYSSGFSWVGLANIKAKTFSMPTPSASQAYVECTTVVNGSLNIELDYLVDATANTFQALNLGSNTALQLSFKVGSLALTNRPLLLTSDADNNVYLDINSGTFAGSTISGGNVVWKSGSRISSTAAITVSGTGAMFTPGYYTANTPQDLSGAGAINVTASHTRWTTTAPGDAGTMANGVVFGQIKIVTMVVDGGDGVLTPTSGVGFTTVTFNDAGDEVHFQWTGFGWRVIKNIGATVA